VSNGPTYGFPIRRSVCHSQPYLWANLVSSSSFVYSLVVGLARFMPYLGPFDTEIEAAQARDQKARERHGPFAYLNSPEAFQTPDGRPQAAGAATGNREGRAIADGTQTFFLAGRRIQGILSKQGDVYSLLQ
jgi:hypothetical protein